MPEKKIKDAELKDLPIHKSRLGKINTMPGGPVTMKIRNGPLFVIEEMPWIQSASIGFFKPGGSGHEPSDLAGITHFIEHLIFKGTRTRSPRDIALAFEGVGGILNASTGKEIMNVYGRIISRYARRGFNVIADMFLNPRFLPQDIDKERGVILEEIRMNKDLPDQFLYEHFSKQIWGRSPLARPIAGNEKSLSHITYDTIMDWYKKHFRPENIVISVSGNIDAESIPEWWLRISGSDSEVQLIQGKSRGYQIKPVKPKWRSGIGIYRKDVEQATVIFGFPAPDVRDQEKYPFTVLEAILGGGMGSRLFQQIREKSGLAYDIDTGFSPMRATGVMTIDSATAPHLLFRLIKQILRELKKVRDKPANQSELRRVKDLLEGSTFLGMEASSNRMYKNALAQIFFGELVPTEIIMQRVAKVTSEQVCDVARKFFTVDNLACGVMIPNDWGSDEEVRQKVEKLIRDNLA